jgi:WD40 repeat protein
VLVWDGDTGRLVAAQPHVHSGSDRVKSVSFSSDGRYLIMSSMGEVVKVWLVADVMKEASVSGKPVDGLL